MKHAPLFAPGLLALACNTSLAQPAPDERIEEVTVTGVRQRLYESGLLKDVIRKTEVISSLNMKQHNAGTLTEAIAFSPGGARQQRVLHVWREAGHAQRTSR